VGTRSADCVVGRKVCLGTNCRDFAYVVVRLFQVVGSDLSLLGQQSKFMVRAVRRESEKDQLAKLPVGPETEFRTPENYGRRVQ
jgi:hypothetical protein